jgi:sec-independent protein translocase protein TatC
MIGRSKAEKVKKPADEMTLFEHLDELRQRLVKAIIGLVIGMVLGTFLTEPVLRILIAPLGDLSPVALSPTETPSVFFKLALLIGTVIAMPVIVYQLFQFAAPGMRPEERRYLFIGAPVASLSFAAGVVFAATVILPAAVPFLKGFLGDIVEPTYSIDKYIGFVGNILLWAGLVFETPLIMYFLAILGVVTPEGFGKARRIVIVGAAVGAAVITPTLDPVNMMALMVPFILLYELGILLAKLARRRRRGTA